MKRENWVWIPHHGHFICSRDCKFMLNTYVGGYLVSTIGELEPDMGTREITARSRGIVLEGIGAARRYDAMKKLGFDTIGCDRTYETMVFKAQRAPKGADYQCCPWRQVSGESVDFAGYNDPVAAREGHMKLCLKWSKKGEPK